jgi:predicted permease
MMAMEPILAAVLPIVLTALIGFVLQRLGKPVEGETLRFVVVQVGTPALIFSILLKTELSAAMLLDYAGAAVAAMLAFGVIGYLVLGMTNQSQRAFLPSMMFGNTGNLGLPLALYACGPAGLGFAAVYHSVATVGNLTLGQSIAMGSSNWRALATNSSLLAVILGVICMVQHYTLPLWLHNSLEVLSGLSIPLMLLMLGSSLATIQVTALKRAFWLSSLRIGMGIAVGFTLAWTFGFTGVARTVLVLQCATPVAVYNYLFALVGKSDPQGVASLVVVSTVMSVLTIPVLLAFLL